MCSSVLEGEHSRADLARLAVPDKLHFPFVLEEQEAVLLGQCLAFVDELDEVSFLGIRELVPPQRVGGSCSRLVLRRSQSPERPSFRVGAARSLSGPTKANL